MRQEGKLQEVSVPRVNSGRFTNLNSDKLRGGYYTSESLAQWLCTWAIRSTSESVLEPSCGDGVFLEAAAQRLNSLGARTRNFSSQLFGIELLAEEADKARARLACKVGHPVSSAVETTDFFAWWKRPNRQLFEVVVGNPPFIRYQSFPEPYRSRAMAIMNEQGLSPNRLTNIWVPFVVAAVATLRPGGRMALVLPAELLQVSYAAQLRSFLTDRFERIDLVACNELFFDKAEQEVLLVLADGMHAEPAETNLCKVTLTEAASVADILGQDPAAILKGVQPKEICHDSEKWLKYFLSSSEITFIRELRKSGVAMPLSTHASVNVGVVTGKNQFFVLRQSQIETHGLRGHTIPLISRSAHLMGAQINKDEWEHLAATDQLVNLLHLAPINGTKPKGKLESYIRFGENQKIHYGYKCSIREPWYAVPSVWIPDAFMFRQIYDFPRVVLNTSEATSTDTIHRMRCKADPHAVVTNLYTSLTAASSEIEGRSYGGGVLELEPKEAERLLMPAELGTALPLDECDRLVRAGRLSDVLDENDRLVLRETMGLSSSECRVLRRMWGKMLNRRLARRRNA